MFSVAKSETGNGLDACTGCELLPTKPGAGREAQDEAEEITELVEEIADIIAWEDGGFSTDWSLYPFEYQKLFVVFRQAERQIERIKEIRFQNFVKSFSGLKE